ncbi:MAG: FAD/NAD(P)-binding protein [Candidatus Omnitrophota bacterium]|nr:FAD/NAD(P)-binding protein [Candidatus Omnitrophota bacterium]MBU1929295.1 FAD/NAD(P)-binding protein [Candidatus Omnitrophota bacterium]MBU2035587.1 FAD/NAD(P)-binding protein [Candidatus Omnitrophota bacterium]MBU2222163.1 FAD/NAD(P)-binding protein [Candidatus Omnitrophota bacterium]
MKNIYKPTEAIIEGIITESPNIKTFVLRPKVPFEFKTGQFIELTLPGIGEAPFTPSSDPNIKDKMDITIMKAGEITSLLHGIQPNTPVGIRGPYGLGYPLDKFTGKDILIVGGGVGLAPLRSLLFALFGSMDKYNKVVLRYGSRTANDIIYKGLIPEWAKLDKVNMMVTVDVGDPSWSGNVGLVTTILKDLPVDLNNAAVIVCGPPIMMKFVTLKLLDLGFKPPDIYLSMEKSMSCGLGKCGHCRIGPYYVCKDGPVFTYEQLKDLHDIWD